MQCWRWWGLAMHTYLYARWSPHFGDPVNTICDEGITLHRYIQLKSQINIEQPRLNTE